MKKIDPRIRQFLDTEAQVDDEISEEDEQTGSGEIDREDGFIDDDTPPDVGHSVLPTQLSVHRHTEGALERLISRIESRINAAGDGGFAIPEDPDDTLHDNGLLYIPRADDYPLWRVECRVGIEEQAVMSLLSTVSEVHQVRSAFTRGSTQGSIYIECKMNQALVDLLLRTPGVLRNGLGIKRQLIDSSEYSQVLGMRDGPVDVGAWVVIKKGLYKGDVGVVSQKSFQHARILLIPRLHTTPQNPLKRKSSTVKPAAKLFDPDHFRQLFPTDVQSRGPDCYCFRDMDFEQGLLAQNLDHRSFTVNVKDIPHDFYTMFRMSQHPAVNRSHMPRPREWTLKEGDAVLICSTPSTSTSFFAPAILKVMDTYYAEVLEIGTHGVPLADNPTKRVPWQEIRKDVKIGQHVCVRGGHHTGKTGWVVALKDDRVHFVSKKFEGEIPTYFRDGDEVIESTEVFVNFVDIAKEPVVLHHKHEPEQTAIIPYVRQPESGPLPKTPPHPWCGVKVKISKQHHPRKGEYGVIQDVKENLDDNTITLHMQLTRYDPNAPFHRISVRYDDVVEFASSLELVLFLDPGEGHIRPTPTQTLSTPQPEQGHDTSAHHPYLMERPSGSATPLPTPAPNNLSSPPSPAWDPSSRTPLSDSVASDPLWMPPAPPPHVLLNPKLVGVKLNAVVDGGDFSKQLIAVSIELHGNE
ncbi:Transcription elongation factor SPT5, partial [Psilocybe cubensis]